MNSEPEAGKPVFAELGSKLRRLASLSKKKSSAPASVKSPESSHQSSSVSPTSQNVISPESYKPLFSGSGSPSPSFIKSPQMLSSSSNELSPENAKFEVAEKSGNKKKKHSKFKSLDLKMLSPRNLFSPNSKDGLFGTGESPSSSSSPFKFGGSRVPSLFQGLGPGKRSTFFTPLRTNDEDALENARRLGASGSVSSFHSKDSETRSVISQTDLPPLPRIIIPEYIQFVDASNLGEFEDLHDKQLVNPYVGKEYLLNELDALLKVKAKLKFRFFPNSCEFIDLSSDTNKFESFDAYLNIMVVHVGQLFERPEVFQLHSSARGISLYEAASFEEKLEVCGLIMFFAQNPNITGLTKQKTLTTITPSMLTATSEPEEQVTDADLKGAPVKFVRSLKEQMREFEMTEKKIKAQEGELANLKNHFMKLESNGVSLSDGIQKQQKVRDDSSVEIENLKHNFEKYAEIVKNMREEHLDKIQRDVEVTFPELLDKLKLRIEVWTEQDRKMRQSMEFLNKFQFVIYVTIISVIVLYLSFWYYRVVVETKI